MECGVPVCLREHANTSHVLCALANPLVAYTRRGPRMLEPQCDASYNGTPALLIYQTHAFPSECILTYSKHEPDVDVPVTATFGCFCRRQSGFEIPSLARQMELCSPKRRNVSLFDTTPPPPPGSSCASRPLRFPTSCETTKAKLSLAESQIVCSRPQEMEAQVKRTRPSLGGGRC